MAISDIQCHTYQKEIRSIISLADAIDRQPTSEMGFITRVEFY